MRSVLKTLAIFLLVALMPMRAMAAVTTGFCPSGHADMATAAHAEHGHTSGEHAQDPDNAASNTSEPACNICAEHCSSAAFAPSVNGAFASLPAGPQRTQLAERAAPAAHPDALDRPPLV